MSTETEIPEVVVAPEVVAEEPPSKKARVAIDIRKQAIAVVGEPLSAKDEPVVDFVLAKLSEPFSEVAKLCIIYNVC